MRKVKSVLRLDEKVSQVVSTSRYIEKLADTVHQRMDVVLDVVRTCHDRMDKLKSSTATATTATAARGMTQHDEESRDE